MRDVHKASIFICQQLLPLADGDSRLLMAAGNQRQHDTDTRIRRQKETDGSDRHGEGEKP